MASVIGVATKICFFKFICNFSFVRDRGCVYLGIWDGNIILFLQDKVINRIFIGEKIVTLHVSVWIYGDYRIINHLKLKMGHHQLDTLDEQILKLIADNARIPFLEVARACNVSGAAIHQRIQKLTNMGILKGSEYVINPEKIGYETCAYIGIFLQDPASFDAVTKALEAIPEVVECHFTTGKYDMFIKLYARNNHHLLSIIHDKLQPLGLARTETLISFHEAIKRQMPIEIEEGKD